MKMATVVITASPPPPPAPAPAGEHADEDLPVEAAREPAEELRGPDERRPVERIEVPALVEEGVESREPPRERPRPIRPGDVERVGQPDAEESRGHRERRQGDAER